MSALRGAIILARSEQEMTSILKRFSFLFVLALFLGCGHLPAVEAGSAPQSSTNAPSLRIIQNTGGGTIVWGTVPGQQTYQTVLSVMLKRVESDYGDRPQMGNLLQSRNGNFWQGFFTFTNKKQTGSAPMTGMVILYAPPSGTSGGATLIDTTANFTTSANSMVQALIKAVETRSQGGQSAQAAPSPRKAVRLPARRPLPAPHLPARYSSSLLTRFRTTPARSAYRPDGSRRALTWATSLRLVQTVNRSVSAS
jgi:hypothetical protein